MARGGAGGDTAVCACPGASVCGWQCRCGPEYLPECACVAAPRVGPRRLRDESPEGGPTAAAAAAAAAAVRPRGAGGSQGRGAAVRGEGEGSGGPEPWADAGGAVRVKGAVARDDEVRGSHRCGGHTGCGGQTGCKRVRWGHIGVPWGHVGAPWGAIMVPWGAMGCYGVLWGAMGCCGVLWGAMGCYGVTALSPQAFGSGWNSWVGW